MNRLKDDQARRKYEALVRSVPAYEGYFNSVGWMDKLIEFMQSAEFRACLAERGIEPVLPPNRGKDGSWHADAIAILKHEPAISVRRLAARLGIGKSVAGEWLQKYRKQRVMAR